MERATSDFVALFHRQFNDGVVAPRLYVSTVPERIISRLEPHGLVFETLPGLLQRAVLWDTGLLLKGTLPNSSSESITEDTTLVQTWTRCGSSMADIVIQPQEFAATASSCHLDTCSETSGGGSVFTSGCCDFASVIALSKCAVASDVVAPVSSDSIWSHERASDMEARVPSFVIHRHTTSGCSETADSYAEDANGSHSSLYSIRTAPRGSAGACSRALVIPCAAVDLVTNILPSQEWCYPTSEPLLETWLRDYANSTITEFVAPWFPSKVISSALVESNINAGSPFDTSAAFAKLLDSSMALPADLTRYYFRLYTGRTWPLKLESGIPAEILARLEPFQVTFHDLSGLLQRALLWDTGYVPTPNVHGKLQLVEIHVKCGLRMANIAVTKAYVEATGCAVDDCSVRNATSNTTLRAYRASKGCTLEQLEGAALCAAAGTSAVVQNDGASTLWAIADLSGASRNSVPDMRVGRRVANASVLFTIDASSVDVAVGQCPERPSLTIPCVAYDRVTLQSEWCRPVQSDLVTAWIEFEEKQYLALINLIVLSGSVLLAVALDLFIDRKPRQIRAAAIGANAPSLDSVDMDITEQSAHQSVTSVVSSRNQSSAVE